MMQRFQVLLVVTIVVCMAFPTTAEEEQPVITNKVIHTTVDRLDAEPLDPELLGQVTPESEARIAELQDRLMQGHQHPQAGPPFETVDVPAELLVPRNPPTDPNPVDGPTGSVFLYVNSTASDVASVSSRSEVSEPAVAASGDRVFYSANWFGATSANGGTDFSFVNPSPGPFPAPSGELFCCDQTIAHDPASNTIFWLQQFIPHLGTDTGTQRINVDQNSDGSWDCAYDINTLLVGFPTNTWFDFPDLTVSSNFLYHASNTFTFAGGWAGGYVGRYPLTELAACSTPLTIDANISNQGSFRFARGADDVMYYADMASSIIIRVWSWGDGEPSPSYESRIITAHLNFARQCPGPDGRNWCGFHDGRIQGGFLSGDTVGFMWTPSQGGSFPFPYVRISTFDTANNLASLEDIDIWSPDVAYMYPSVSVNSNGELGGTVMWGGGTTHYASCSAWMASTPTSGDLVPLDHTTSIAGTIGPTNPDHRSGDYTMSTSYYPDDLQFAGACFAYLSPGSSTSTYMRFGNPSASLIFVDGFESGDTDAWSSVSP